MKILPWVQCIPRGLLIISLALMGAIPSSGEGPRYRNPNNFDGEYALDLLSNELPPDWRTTFRGSENGIQMGGGSLNIRHITLTEDIKVRVPLITDRFIFRFRRERIAGLERDDEWNLLDFETRVTGPWHVSLVGNPSFHKSDATIGFATAWRVRPDQYARFSYLWPRFDTNYAFENQSVNEGYTEAFRKFPGEARLETVWQNDRTSLFLDARHGRPWELDHRTLDPTPSGYIEQGEMSELIAELRHRVGDWTMNVQAKGWRSEGRLTHDPSRPDEDNHVLQDYQRFFFTLDRKLSERRTLRAGAGPSLMRGRKELPYQSTKNNRYHYEDTIGLLSYLPRWSPQWSGETAYMINFQEKVLTQGADSSRSSQIHNRIKFALRWEGTRASFVIAGNVEMDQSEAETPVSFDGGTLQFQTLF
ncbi:MAG: hypothetical protein JNK54_06030 [Elusimicrobia bacterium]|nr:hypothetical protein [Elusimicrobiota bacterium]